MYPSEVLVFWLFGSFYPRDDAVLHFISHFSISMLKGSSTFRKPMTKILSLTTRHLASWQLMFLVRWQLLHPSICCHLLTGSHGNLSFHCHDVECSQGRNQGIFVLFLGGGWLRISGAENDAFLGSNPIRSVKIRVNST